MKLAKNNRYGGGAQILDTQRTGITRGFREANTPLLNNQIVGSVTSKLYVGAPRGKPRLSYATSLTYAICMLHILL
jgi:hypothetical protein